MLFGRIDRLPQFFPMDKRTFSQLVDAYADAKLSRNQHLANTMVAQLQQALDVVFPDAEVSDPEPDSQF